MSKWTVEREANFSHLTYRVKFDNTIAAEYGMATGGEVWYDPSERLWTGYLINDRHHQMSPAEYDTDREDLQRYVESFDMSPAEQYELALGSPSSYK